VKILIASDVDPVLPGHFARKPDGDIWEPLKRIPELVTALGDGLPPITWMIRSDESIRFCTGDYASGYARHGDLWAGLVKRGHELGWHMHLLSYDDGRQAFTFDRRPGWLADACAALAAHYPVRATRTGWNFADNALLGGLDGLGVDLDASASPGAKAWYTLGPARVTVDWRRCSEAAYRPSRNDYQRPGAEPLRLIEVPVAQFRHTPIGLARRLAWRLAHGCVSFAGLSKKTRLMTEAWNGLPPSGNDVWVFYFHPEDLTAAGIANFEANLRRLRGLPQVEFLTASAVHRWYAPRLGVAAPSSHRR
jgi:hypothetical protein